MAIELHDDILSHLTSMAIMLHNSRRHLGTDPTQTRYCLEILAEEIQYLNYRLREITQGLHPSVLTDLGLIPALQAYIDSLARQPLPDSTPKTIALTAQGFNGNRIPKQKQENDLYYLTRQALDNALVHAHTEQVFIHLRWGQEAISITVRDKGRGMKDAPEALMGQNGHLGLLSMNERALAWRGRLAIHTAPDQGTTVQARIPINQPTDAPSHLQTFTQYLTKLATTDRRPNQPPVEIEAPPSHGGCA